MKLIGKISISQKRIFLIDGLGALLTTIMLLLIAIQFELDHKYFHFLPTISFCLFIYSIFCHLFIKNKWKSFLKAILAFNSFYLLLSMSFLIINFKKLNELIIVYFILELLIISAVILIEYKLFINEK